MAAWLLAAGGLTPQADSAGVERRHRADPATVARCTALPIHVAKTGVETRGSGLQRLVPAAVRVPKLDPHEQVTRQAVFRRERWHAGEEAFVAQ